MTNLLEPDEVPMLHTQAAAEEGQDSGDASSWERGEKQPTQCRDMPFAAVFLIQFTSIAVYGSVLLVQQDNSDAAAPEFDVDFRDVILPVVAGILSCIFFIFLSFIVLTKMGTQFIACSVWTSVFISAAIAVAALVRGSIIMGVFCSLSALIGYCYARAVKNRIPFAAANLNAGVSAVKKNLGIFFIPPLAAMVFCCWLVQWTVSLFAITGVKQVCPDDGGECTVEITRGGWIFPWVLLLFWTIQVVKFGIHCTVAGVVSTWYFDPMDAQGCCSKAVRESTTRSLTSSFGSICLGSLLVAIIQFLDFVVTSLRQNNRDRGAGGAEACLLCCLDCILHVIEDIMKYFNKWVSNDRSNLP